VRGVDSFIEVELLIDAGFTAYQFLTNFDAIKMFLGRSEGMGAKVHVREKEPRSPLRSPKYILS